MGYKLACMAGLLKQDSGSRRNEMEQLLVVIFLFKENAKSSRAFLAEFSEQVFFCGTPRNLCALWDMHMAERVWLCFLHS